MSYVINGLIEISEIYGKKYEALLKMQSSVKEKLNHYEKEAEDIWETYAYVSHHETQYNPEEWELPSEVNKEYNRCRKMVDILEKRLDSLFELTETVGYHASALEDAIDEIQQYKEVRYDAA
jgi:prefoldin subunit 5